MGSCACDRIITRLDALRLRGVSVNAPKDKSDTHTEFQSSLGRKSSRNVIPVGRLRQRGGAAPDRLGKDHLLE